MPRNPFEFIGEPPLTVPMITPGQQLAEKLHAYTRRYDDERSSRAKDFFDMLVISDQVQLPEGAVLGDIAAATFAIRSTPWPLNSSRHQQNGLALGQVSSPNTH